ncbi:hypothetical protein [Polyangium spumosum]|uniref:PRTRC system protein F n=1 Tax=Polyangium spumosum TaxID=889282 RepID=A0A6N7PYH2_9BACT|nr:hypothetical protein [Polyangium spumosum]MRG97252.1 hypothetical protein [Polyangium spumosum]
MTHFFAWCEEAKRFEVFMAVLATLVPEGGSIDGTIEGTGEPLSVSRRELALAAAWARGHAAAHFYSAGASGCPYGMSVEVDADSRFRLVWGGPLTLGVGGVEERFTINDIYPRHIHIVRDTRVRPLEAHSAVACILAMIDMKDLLLRLCTCHPAITTGGVGWDLDWEAPIEMGGTYHADCAVGRDLAMSWMYYRDPEARLGLAAGWSLERLHEYVAAAPPGASVPLARGDVLTREQVLAALSLPPSTLLDALEACASADAEWLAVEPKARHLLLEVEKMRTERGEKGMNLEKVDVASAEHARFIEEHAPFEVHRLPNGGVLLATHPFRTLWQLWADALNLLGIRT